MPCGQFVNLGIRRLNKPSKYSYNISAYRCDKTSELLAVVHSSDLKNPCTLYSYRWQIETMFKAFKSSGFNIENTKVVNYDKLETLFSAMAIAFTISYDIGDNYEQKNPQKLKKHGYKPIATIKLGISLIKNWIFNHKKLSISKLYKIVKKADKYYTENNNLVTSQFKIVV